MIVPDSTWAPVFGYVNTDKYDLNNVTWVNGYVSTSGAPTASAYYMRSHAIRAGTFPAGCRLKFGAFSSYTLRVAEFNDTGESAVVKAANYIKSYPESGFSYEVEFEYNPAHCYSVTIGKFADSSARDAARTSESFIRAIRCWVYEESDPYYDVMIRGTLNDAWLDIKSENILSAKIERNIFPHNYLEVGNIASEKLTFSTIGLDQLEPSTVYAFISVVSGANPDIKSNKVLLGRYQLDSATHSHGSNIYTYECTPVPIVNGVDIPYDEYKDTSFPTTPYRVYQKILPDLHIYKRDDDTMATLQVNPYSIPNYGRNKGAVYTSDMFRMVASSLGGNWVREPYRDSSSLGWGVRIKLVPLFAAYVGDEVDIGKSASRIESTMYGVEYTGVQLLDSGVESYFSGSKTGNVLRVSCRFGTQSMADNILTNIQDLEYKGVIAYNVPGITPLLHLGDRVIIDDIEVDVNYQVLELGPQILQTIGAKMVNASTTEQLHAESSTYATNESLGNGTAGLNVQEIVASKIIIVDTNGDQHELSLINKGSATMVLGY